MAASPGFRIGAIALVASLLAAVALILIVNSSDEADAAPSGPKTPAKAMLLRVADLPEGYEYFSPDWDGVFNPDVTCSRIAIPDAAAKLEEWVEDAQPRGCYALFYRLGGSSPDTVKPIPPLVGTGAVDVGSVKEAKAGFDLAADLLDHISEGKLTASPEPGSVGDEVAVFRSRNRFVGEISGGGTRTSFLVWRSGETLGVVMVGGGKPRSNELEALELAQRQQQHVR